MRQIKIQKRLGRNPDAKLLIIHADDVGLCHSVNKATIECFEKGYVNSASVMVNCPWFNQAVKYFKARQGLDLGIHITITSEWNTYKWGPVLPAASVSSLVDGKGFFWGHDFHHYVDAKDVEYEVRAQIEKALAFGLSPTHLDCHMNCLYLREDLFEIYVKLGREYQLPIMVNKEYAHYFNIDIDQYLDKDAVIVDKIYMARPENTQNGIANYYQHVVRNLQPGLNVLLVHPGQNDDEMRAISEDVYPWGAEWREHDRDFFTSKMCKEILDEEGISLITWKELKENLIDNKSIEVSTT